MKIDAYLKLLPTITDSNREFWAGCSAGELRLQACEECGQFRYPDSQVCPNCLSDRFSWKATSGRGVLWSWIIMHQKYYEAFADELPYLVAFVQLEEGPFMMSTLVPGSAEPQIDAGLEVVFDRVADDRSVPKFRLVAQ